MAHLEDLQKFDVEEFFNTKVAQYVDALRHLEESVSNVEVPQHDEHLQAFVVAARQSFQDLQAAEEQLKDDKELLRSVQNRFREVIAPWHDQSWFLNRAKNKPRGYPGDYEMLTAIYDEKPKGKGLAGYLDLYFLGSDLARAVRSRMDCVQRFLVKEVLQRSTRFSLLNVASGPGREFSEGVVIPETVQLTCLDSDEKALEYLRDHIDPDSSASVDLSCVCYNVLKMTSSESSINKFGRPDMIYSVGLCDYIPDRYLSRILNGWRETVKPDGIIYVAFKDTLKYYASEYQWHVDWHFYKRTEADCLKLFADAGYNVEAMQVTRDETGIIMNFIARAAAIQSDSRIDTAHGKQGPHLSSFGKLEPVKKSFEPATLGNDPQES